MARGPKPQPAAVKLQRGSSRRRVADDALGGAGHAGAVAAPAWLKGEALKIWASKASALTSAKLLAETDATAFGRYCRNLADWLRYKAVLDEKGDTYSVTTASGLVIRPRPEFLMADRVERQLLAAEDRFGLNPAERQRIYAARASRPEAGDLFGGPRAENPATPAAEPARPAQGPIGLLN